MNSIKKLDHLDFIRKHKAFMGCSASTENRKKPWPLKGETHTSPTFSLKKSLFYGISKWLVHICFYKLWKEWILGSWVHFSCKIPESQKYFFYEKRPERRMEYNEIFPEKNHSTSQWSEWGIIFAAKVVFSLKKKCFYYCGRSRIFASVDISYSLPWVKH